MDQPRWPELPVCGAAGAPGGGLRRGDVLRVVPHERPRPRPTGASRVHGHGVPDRRRRSVRGLARGGRAPRPSRAVSRSVRACAGPVRAGPGRPRPRPRRRAPRCRTGVVPAAAARLVRPASAPSHRRRRPDLAAVVSGSGWILDARARDRRRGRRGHRRDRVRRAARVAAGRRSRRRSSGARSPTSRAARNTSSPTRTSPSRARSRTGS